VNVLASGERLKRREKNYKGSLMPPIMPKDPVGCLPEKEKALLTRMVDAKLNTLKSLMETESANVDSLGAGMSLHPQEIQEQLDAAAKLKKRLDTADCREL
tara:strand:+ start:973 stop:1275 length:303 start_codon:yes stop_codon:yes gene_type:complete